MAQCKTEGDRKVDTVSYCTLVFPLPNRDLYLNKEKLFQKKKISLHLNLSENYICYIGNA